MNIHQIIVGNIGTVYDGNNGRDARRFYREYVKDSKDGYGRAAHEPVTWMYNGEIYEEHAPGPLYSWEYTDTFGGEANYSWVRRGTIEAPNERAAVIRAKKAAGLTGITCTREDWSDGTIVLRPQGSCTVLFITPKEP